MTRIAQFIRKIKSKKTATVLIGIGGASLLIGATYHRLTVFPGFPISQAEISQRIETLKHTHYENDYSATAAARAISEWRANMEIKDLRAGRVRKGTVTLAQDDLFFLGGMFILLGTVIFTFHRLDKK